MISTGKVVQLFASQPSILRLKDNVWDSDGRGRMYSVFRGYEALASGVAL